MIKDKPAPKPYSFREQVSDEYTYNYPVRPITRREWIYGLACDRGVSDEVFNLVMCDLIKNDDTD